MAAKGKNYVQHCNSIGNWKYAFTCLSLSSLSARVERTRGQNTKNKLKLKRFYAIDALHNTINIKFKRKKYTYCRFVLLYGLASIAVIFLENTTAASAPSRIWINRLLKEFFVGFFRISSCTRKCFTCIFDLVLVQPRRTTKQACRFISTLKILDRFPPEKGTRFAW